MENKLMVQFTEFNLRQETNLEDVYELSSIGEKCEEELENMYEVGKMCKVLNIDEVQKVEIESLDWKQYKGVNKTGEYAVLYPLYTLLCEDGQILYEYSEKL